MVVGHGLEPCTKNIGIIKSSRLQRRSLDLYFVDTPGIDVYKKKRREEEILDMLASSLEKM